MQRERPKTADQTTLGWVGRGERGPDVQSV